MRKYQLSKTNKLKINLISKSFFLVNVGGEGFGIVYFWCYLILENS